MSRKVIVNPSSIKLVREELQKLVQQASADFEALTRQQEPAHGEACRQKLQQIRGVYCLLALDDAAMLAEELAAMIGESSNALAEGQSLSTELCTRALLILAQYPDYLLARRLAIPALLLEDINALRALRRQVALPEVLFLADELPAEPQMSGETRRLDGDLELVRRLRHMYQVGLLVVIKERLSLPHLRLMQRAAQRMEDLAGGGAGAEFWWLLNGVLNAFADGQLAASPSRKRLLAAADRQFRACLQSEGELAPTPEVIRRELVYVASQGGSCPRAEEIRACFGLQDRVVSDADLARERARLLGPSGETVRSMVAALRAELERGKALLDELAASGSGVPPQEARDHLAQAAAVMKGAGLVDPAKLLLTEVERLDAWRSAGQSVAGDDLASVADAILQVETTLAGVQRSGISSPEALSGQGQSALHQGVLDEAQTLVLNEAAKTLEGIKRLVDAFVEANYERSTLAAGGAAMRTVAGSLSILNQHEAAHVMDLCARTLDHALSDRGAGLDARALAEGIADVLICVEYFIETLGQGEQPDASIMAMAEDSLKALFASVAKAS